MMRLILSQFYVKPEHYYNVRHGGTVDGAMD